MSFANLRHTMLYGVALRGFIYYFLCSDVWFKTLKDSIKVDKMHFENGILLINL